MNEERNSKIQKLKKVNEGNQKWKSRMEKVNRGRKRRKEVSNEVRKHVWKASRK